MSKQTSTNQEILEKAMKQANEHCNSLTKFSTLETKTQKFYLLTETQLNLLGGFKK